MLAVAPAPGATATSPAAGDRPQTAAARPNLLLITVDTLRPDALGWVAGGNPTVELDALAAGGFRFPAALSPAPITLPAHASLLTALVPRRHGVRDNGQVLAAAAPRTLAEELAARGWTTGAFVSGYPLAAGFGLDRGFAVYDDELPAGGLERRAADTRASALAWAREAAEPWFLWVHFYDPHDPYEPPAGLGRPGPRGAYDGEVLAVDREVGALRRGLASAAGRPLVTMFAADHGESLGEHGEATHGFFVYQSTAEIPLVFHWPGRIAPGASRASARLVDVAPTLLDLLGLPAWPGVDGVSLAPLIAGGEAPPPPAVIESQRPWLGYGWAPLRAVVADGWKLIAAPRPELYHLATDPGERRNLIDRERPEARRLERLLRQAERPPVATAAGRSTDPEALAALRALGYTGAGGDRGAPPAGLADPKDRVELWNLLGEAEARLAAGDVAGAVTRFDRVLATEPANPFALARSGMALLAGGDPAAALPRLTRAAAVDPEQPEIRDALARTLVGLGRPAQAAEQWMEMARLQPRRPEVWARLGSALGLAGRPGEAVEAMTRAVELDPGDPRLRTRLAFAEHAAGRPRRAADELLRAAELSGEEGFPHAGSLGLLLSSLNDAEGARRWLERSRPEEPDYARARLALARLELVAGEREAAGRALRQALAAEPGLRAAAAADPELAALLPPPD